VQKDDEAYVLLHAYGERRGLLGNGPTAWGGIVIDAVFGWPNDYYQMSLLAPFDSSTASGAADVVALANTVFPRVAVWYAAQ
jgi:hypothetical protein